MSRYRGETIGGRLTLLRMAFPEAPRSHGMPHPFPDKRSAA